MPSRRRAAAQIAGLLVWAAAISLSVLLEVYPRLVGDWTATVVQLGSYVVIAVPVLLLRPRVPLPLGLSRWVVVVAVVLLVAAVAYEAVLGASVDSGLRHAVRAVSAGVGEELVFRGAVFARLGALLAAVVPRTLIDAALFAAFHLPLVVVQGGGPAALLAPFGFGLLFSLLRRVSRGLALPAAVHVAVDLSS